MENSLEVQEKVNLDKRDILVWAVQGEGSGENARLPGPRYWWKKPEKRVKKLMCLMCLYQT